MAPYASRKKVQKINTTQLYIYGFHIAYISSVCLSVGAKLIAARSSSSLSTFTWAGHDGERSHDNVHNR